MSAPQKIEAIDALDSLHRKADSEFTMELTDRYLEPAMPIPAAASGPGTAGQWRIPEPPSLIDPYGTFTTDRFGQARLP